eukprot:TRINITY_DN13088_c0_g1_i1.p1 TRINITY_DN13088_c0_g1~~TRINITY_DN13088_c0_g1_i1.p1  ORF type:complete len:158 (+),score=46.51 TRINITY_DN13088_c0_g1_i1:36-476(+)
MSSPNTHSAVIPGKSWASVVKDNIPEEPKGNHQSKKEQNVQRELQSESKATPQAAEPTVMEKVTEAKDVVVEKIHSAVAPVMERIHDATALNTVDLHTPEMARENPKTIPPETLGEKITSVKDAVVGFIHEMTTPAEDAPNDVKQC